MLNDTEKRTLVALARDAVEARIARREPVVPSPLETDASGVFVTLKRRGDLRGCLGTLECQHDLAAEVARCAVQSATEDPRFSPVTRDDLTELTYEVSVLGPLERIDPIEPQRIAIGTHGLVVERGSRRGLLLPQVAAERHWTPEQFLRQTCVKAGLAEDAWQHGAEVYRFSAVVFGDTDR